MPSTYRASNARLSWTADGLPFAEDYGDIYYSRADALGESTHVFLDGNDLPARFCGLAARKFVIGELGFGAGLNFLNTCRLWSSHAPPAATLHYVACELHPFSKSDLERLLTSFADLAPFAHELLLQYPGSSSGLQQLELKFGTHRVCLTLLHEDAVAAFEGLHAQPSPAVDAWFLDGFSPRRNPQMWSAPLLQQLAALSRAGTTLASYSVAGEFRRRLQQAGFQCEKARGFTGKRHMLRARFGGDGRAPAPPLATGLVCVIGAGLAGCSTAHALASAGWQVLLVEQAAAPASAASGNPQGILHFKPATVDNADNRFNLQAYLYAARRYRSLHLPSDTWSACGMLQLAHDHKLRKRFQTLTQSDLYPRDLLQVLDANDASILCGQAVAQPALYFPDAGWLSPPRLCEHYLRHPGIQLLTGHCVTQLDRGNEGWEVLMHGDSGERFQHAQHVVLCNSADAWRFLQARNLPLISNRGQVDLYPAKAQRKLDTVVCGQGYLIPGGADGQLVGGSFFLGPDSVQQREENRQQHLSQLSGIHAELAEHFAGHAPVAQRIAERCTLPGRLPAVGALQPGLWINTGHGSHGLARTPVCAALLASLLGGTPSPLPPELAALLDPLRFEAAD